MTKGKMIQFDRLDGGLSMERRLGILFGLLVAIFLAAVTGAQAAESERASDRFLEWTQETRIVREGKAWRDREGRHYRGFEQVARFTGDCEVDVRIVFNADVNSAGTGLAYGTLRFTSVPHGCFRADLGVPGDYEGRFEYVVKEHRIAEGALAISNASGTQQLIVTELKHIGGTFLEPVLYMRGHGNTFRDTGSAS